MFPSPPVFNFIKLGIYSRLLTCFIFMLEKQWVWDWGVPKMCLCATWAAVAWEQAGHPSSALRRVTVGHWSAPVKGVTPFFQLGCLWVSTLCWERGGMKAERRTQAQAQGSFSASIWLPLGKCSNNLFSAHELGEPQTTTYLGLPGISGAQWAKVTGQCLPGDLSL